MSAHIELHKMMVDLTREVNACYDRGEYWLALPSSVVVRITAAMLTAMQLLAAIPTVVGYTFKAVIYLKWSDVLVMPFASALFVLMGIIYSVAAIIYPSWPYDKEVIENHESFAIEFSIISPPVPPALPQNIVNPRARLAANRALIVFMLEIGMDPRQFGLDDHAALNQLQDVQKAYQKKCSEIAPIYADCLVEVAQRVKDKGYLSADQMEDFDAPDALQRLAILHLALKVTYSEETGEMTFGTVKGKKVTLHPSFDEENEVKLYSILSDFISIKKLLIDILANQEKDREDVINRLELILLNKNGEGEAKELASHFGKQAEFVKRFIRLHHFGPFFNFINKEITLANDVFKKFSEMTNPITSQQAAAQ